MMGRYQGTNEELTSEPLSPLYASVGFFLFVRSPSQR